MNLQDRIDFVGEFTFRAYKADGTFDEFTEKNLIMDEARQNMAQLIGGVTSSLPGEPINMLVLGTEGHTTDILTPKTPGSNGFDATLTALFSESSNTTYYRIPFTATGGTSVSVNGTGTLTLAGTAQGADATANTVERVVSDRTVTYTVTIPAENANSTSALAYTEAALYAGGDIFSMKCFPARVKEDTVRFEIIWSIIF